MFNIFANLGGRASARLLQAAYSHLTALRKNRLLSLLLALFLLPLAASQAYAGVSSCQAINDDWAAGPIVANGTYKSYALSGFQGDETITWSFVDSDGDADLLFFAPENFDGTFLRTSGSFNISSLSDDLGVITSDDAMGMPGMGDGVAQLTITCNGSTPAAPTLSSASPNSGDVAGGTEVTLTGTNFTHTYDVIFDGTSSPSWTVVSDTTITATAPAHDAGPVDVVVTTDGGTATLTGGYTYQVPGPAFTVSPASGSLADAVVGEEYVQAFYPSVDVNSQITSGSLPPGMLFDNRFGIPPNIYGTPTETGHYTFTIEFTDTAAHSVEETYTLDVVEPVSSNAALSGLSASGGTLAPAFDADTESYTVTVPAETPTVTLTATAADAGATISALGDTQQASLSLPGIVVSNTSSVAFAVTAPDGTTTRTYTVNIVHAASNNVYFSSLTASAGTLSPAYSPGQWNFTLAVPAGTDTVEITPTLQDPAARLYAGSTPITSGAPYEVDVPETGSVDVEFWVYAASNQNTGRYTITVSRAAAPVWSDATLSSLATSEGTLQPPFSPTGTGYNATVSAEVTTATITATTNDLGATLTLNGVPRTSGVAIPVALAVGNNTFEVEVTAADGTTTKTYTVELYRQADFTISPAAGSLPPGVKGQFYTQTFAASGGTGPYQYLLGSDHPPGMTLDPDTGVFSGSPEAVYNFHSTVTVIDANHVQASFDYTWNVTAPSATAFTFTPAPGSLPDGTTGIAYTGSISASGGSGNYAYVVAGPLPAGLSLASDGTWSGTPTEDGTFEFTVTATDGSGTSDSAAYILKIGKPSPTSFTFTPAGGSLPEAMAGENYSTTIAVEGGTAPLVFSLVPADGLPSGLVLNRSTGEISGKLAADAKLRDYTFKLAVEDAAHAKASADYTLTVVKQKATAQDKQVVVPAGSTPVDVRLDAGATGGPFTDAAVAFVEPSSAGTATISMGDYAALSPVTPVGWYLKFKPNPAFSGKAVVGFKLINKNLGGAVKSASGTVTYTLALDEDQVAADIDHLVHSFVSARQGLIASTIEVPSLRDRNALNQATAPVTGGLKPDADGLVLNFATSLVQMNAASRAAAGIINTDAPPPAFNAWLSGTMMVHNRDDNGNRWGTFGMLSAGVDYLLTDRVLIGMSLHLDRMTDPTDEDAEIDGNGWLAGPYASVELVDNVFFDASLLYGGSSNDIGTELFDGSFDTSRWMLDASLSGQWHLDEATILTPRLRVVYLNENVENYSVENAAGDSIDIDGFTEEQFRLSLGAELQHSFTLDNGLTLTPKLGATAGLSTLDTSSLFGQVSASLSFTNGGDWTANAGVLLNFDDKGAVSSGAKASLGIRF